MSGNPAPVMVWAGFLVVGAVNSRSLLDRVNPLFTFRIRTRADRLQSFVEAAFMPPSPPAPCGYCSYLQAISSSPGGPLQRSRSRTDDRTPGGLMRDDLFRLQLAVALFAGSLLWVGLMP